MTIGKKISWSCAGLVALSLVLGIFSLWSIARINNHLESIVTDSLPGVYQIGKLEGLAKDFRGHVLMHVASTDQGQKAGYESALADLERKIRQNLQDYEKTITTSEDRELFRLRKHEVQELRDAEDAALARDQIEDSIV